MVCLEITCILHTEALIMALQDELNHKGTKECNFAVQWFVCSDATFS